jgi:hypothetical protein
VTLINMRPDFGDLRDLMPPRFTIQFHAHVRLGQTVAAAATLLRIQEIDTESTWLHLIVSLPDDSDGADEAVKPGALFQYCAFTDKWIYPVETSRRKCRATTFH